VGDSLLSDARLALEGLYLLLRNITVTPYTSHIAPPLAQSTPKSSTSMMTASEAFTAVVLLHTTSGTLVQGSLSTGGGYAGRLGYNRTRELLHLRQRRSRLGRTRGSLHSPVQSIYTAVQRKLKV